MRLVSRYPTSIWYLSNWNNCVVSVAAVFMEYSGQPSCYGIRRPARRKQRLQLTQKGGCCADTRFAIPTSTLAPDPTTNPSTASLCNRLSTKGRTCVLSKHNNALRKNLPLLRSCSQKKKKKALAVLVSVRRGAIDGAATGENALTALKASCAWNAVVIRENCGTQFLEV